MNDSSPLSSARSWSSLHGVEFVGVGERSKRFARRGDSPGEDFGIINEDLRDRDIIAGHVFLNLHACRLVFCRICAPTKINDAMTPSVPII
jgi:hypothetical protein